MNKISYGQFTALLLICDAFAIICLTGSLSTASALGLILAALIQLAAAIPAILWFKNGGSISQSNALKWIYLIFSIFWGGILFTRVWNTSEAIYIPSIFNRIISDRLVISVLIALICLYVSSSGIKAIGRAAVIAAGFGVLCLIIIILGATGKMDMSYFMLKTDYNLSAGLTDGLALGGSVGSFMILLEFVKDSKLKTSFFYFAGKIIFLFIVAFIAISVSGGIINIVSFPFITTAELSQPFNSQRLDSVFIVIFVLLATLSIALQAIIASHLLKSIFPKFKRFRNITAIAAMLATAFVFAGSTLHSPIYSVIAVLMALPPAVMFIIKKGGKAN